MIPPTDEQVEAALGAFLKAYHADSGTKDIARWDWMHAALTAAFSLAAPAGTVMEPDPDVATLPVWNMESNERLRYQMAARINTDDATADLVIEALIGCAVSWSPSVRLLGNIRAKDIVAALLPPQPSAETESGLVGAPVEKR